MNKKGFTLVELLAVIAILAILVIIALPNVLKMFNDAKKNSFLTETKTIYSEVSKKYISESMKGNKLSYVSSEDDTKLEMTGRDLQYCVLLNTDGTIKSMKVSNGEWVAELPSGKKITDLKSTDLKEGNLDNEECDPYKPKSFAEDSWEIISRVAKSCVNNVENCPYKVGNTKTVKVNGNEFTVRLANLKAPSECNDSDFSQSACGFVVEFQDVIDHHSMNKNRLDSGGWRDCAMRTYLNNDIYNLLDDELKKVISEVPIISGSGKRNKENYVSKDKLYLLSTAEVYEVDESASSEIYDTERGKTRQLDYYNIKGVTTSNYDNARKNDIYWLRSVPDNDYTDFYAVSFDGFWLSGDSVAGVGISPAFRIGY